MPSVDEILTSRLAMGGSNVDAMITVNFHSLKAANSNPVDSLRSE
jgi:hypothetical protein